MAKQTRQTAAPTKKHLARLEREQLQTRYLMIGSAIVLILVIGIIAYGVLNQYVLKGLRPVATVNGDRISSDHFQAQVRYARVNMIRGAQQTFQFAQLFASDPNSAASFVGQLQQIQQQLNPLTVGEEVLNQLIDDRLIRQEAERQGITVSEDEVSKSFEAAFGFFPDGTPTPSATFDKIPTSTLSPLQETLIPPTATPTITPTLILGDVLTDTTDTTADATPSPEATLQPTEAPPTPTATPFTSEGYEQLYQDTMTNFEEEYSIPENELRYVIESQLFSQKVAEIIAADVVCSEEQVWALHILVEDEDLANDIASRLEEGEDWGLMAATYSTDTSNKDKGGDLGWFSKGAMVPEFEEAAFSLEIGEFSQPVQTQFGWHVIRVLGHEERSLSDAQCQQLRGTKIQEWLDEQMNKSEIDIDDAWVEVVPVEPSLPPEILQFIAGAQDPGQVPLPQPAP